MTETIYPFGLPEYYNELTKISINSPCNPYKAGRKLPNQRQRRKIKKQTNNYK